MNGCVGHLGRKIGGATNKKGLKRDALIKFSVDFGGRIHFMNINSEYKLHHKCLLLQPSYEESKHFKCLASSQYFRR